MWCCITGRLVRIFWDSMMVSSSRVECLHWVFRSLKVRPLGCPETSCTNHPVTLPHTRLTGTLSCFNWTDERIATPVPPPIHLCSRFFLQSAVIASHVRRFSCSFRLNSQIWMSLCWRNPPTFFLAISVLIYDFSDAFFFFLFQVRFKFIETVYPHVLNLLKVRNVIC